MPAASNPLTQTGEPITWNFKLLAQNDLGGFGGMGEGMAVQVAKDGRRIIWLAHESAPKNFTGVDVSDPRNRKWWCRPICRRRICARTRWKCPAISWRSPIRRRRRASSRPASSCSTSRCRRSRARSRSSTARARPRAACINCGSATANTCTWPRAPPTSSRATRMTTSSTAASTCAIRRSRWKSAAGGCRARAKATTSRRRRATRSTRAIARTTPTSTSSGRTGFISPISTAACS